MHNSQFVQKYSEQFPVFYKSRFISSRSIPVYKINEVVKMLSNKKEMLLLSYFRNNARESLTRISRKTNIPVSTIFDKLKHYENNIIKKHTALLNFQQLGFDIKICVLFKVHKDQKQPFLSFLLNHTNINSIFRVNSGYDYLAELVFRDMKHLSVFNEQLEKFAIEDRKEYFILDDLKRECFLTREIDINYLFQEAD
jgi:Lrp/AsnC family transcriptional regulator, leucine-responsive regulatory protein